MKKYRITCTHNPQDFFNGNEAMDLAKSYVTDNLDKDVPKELDDGYQVIVSKAGGN